MGSDITALIEVKKPWYNRFGVPTRNKVWINE